MRAQEQDGWVTRAAIEHIAAKLDMAYIRVYEIATFYTMFQLSPVGSRAHIQVCGTTPCMLRGSDDIMAACKARGMKKGHTTDDGLWTLTEVECMGNCASAPMVQINDDNYEDLTAERLDHILGELAAYPVPDGQVPLLERPQLVALNKVDVPEARIQQQRPRHGFMGVSEEQQAIEA